MESSASTEFDQFRRGRSVLVTDDGRRYFEDERGIPVFEHIVNAPTWAFDSDVPPRNGHAEAVMVASVKAAPVRWLWPGRIPRGKLTVLDGDPGLGKSTLTLDLAARVSTGLPMPTGERPPAPAGVLLLSAEDGIGDTIRPRLEAAGAHLERIYVLEEVPCEPVEGSRRNGSTPELDKPMWRPPSIPADVHHLEHLIRRHHVALCVVDPLVAFLSAGTDVYRDQDVRRALHALAAMADRTGVALVVLRHLSKAGGAHPIYRGGGSIGIIGAARAGLLVAPDPEDEGRRILAVSKSNLGVIPDALAFRLVPDEERGCARLSWEGATSHSAADLLGTPSDEGERGAIAEAVDFLEGMMVMGSVRARDAKDAARAAGIAARTLDHARKRLGVTTRREGFGPGATWWWDPPIDANTAHSCQAESAGDNG